MFLWTEEIISKNVNFMPCCNSATAHTQQFLLRYFFPFSPIRLGKYLIYLILGRGDSSWYCALQPFKPSKRLLSLAEKARKGWRCVRTLYYFYPLLGSIAKGLSDPTRHVVQNRVWHSVSTCQKFRLFTHFCVKHCSTRTCLGDVFVVYVSWKWHVRPCMNFFRWEK